MKIGEKIIVSIDSVPTSVTLISHSLAWEHIVVQTAKGEKIVLSGNHE